MTLQKRLVHLNLTGGLQKKDDSRLVIPSKLAVADNVEFDDLSTVIRRGGQAQLSNGVTTGAPFRMFTHQGIAYLEQANGVYRLAAAGGATQVRNDATVDGFTEPYQQKRRAGMTTKRVTGIKPPSTDTAPFDGNYDAAAVGNVVCYVTDTRNPTIGTQTIRVVLVDESNGYVLYDNIVRDNLNVICRPRVLADSANNRFNIYFASFATGATQFTIKMFTLSTAGSAGGLNSVGGLRYTWGRQVCEDINYRPANEILFDFAFSPSGTLLGGVVREDTFLDFLVLSASDGYTVAGGNQLTPAASPVNLAVLYSEDGVDERLHAFYSSGIYAKAASWNEDASTFSAETTVGTGAASTSVGRLSAYQESASQIYLAWDSLEPAGAYSTLRVSRFSHTYGSLTECAAWKFWSIAGRILLAGDRKYLPMALKSANYQGTHFLTDFSSATANLGVSGSVGASPHVVARIDYGEGRTSTLGDSYRCHRVPTAPVVNSTRIFLPYLKFETDLRLAGSQDETAYCLARAQIDLDSQLGHEEVNGTTFLAGACPHIYDGSVCVEEGFHHGPEVLSAGTPAASGTYQFPNATATYSICFTMGWLDAAGNWHESAPSNEVTVSITAGSGNYYITPTVITPPTNKAGAQLCFYRTKGSSTDTAMYLAANSLGASVTSDTTLDDGEQLYTSGGVLPNTPAPACRHVSTFQKRLVLAGCGDGYDVHFSKQVTKGYGVEFSAGDPSHQTRVPVEAGRVVATEEVDDSLFVLCEKSLGRVFGQGPASTGTQGSYSDYSTLATETGADWDSPKAVVRAPEGVWFRSPFGLRLLSRSGSIARGQDGKQAGAEVDSYVSGSLVAVVGPAKQQVRFYSTSGYCLVWDYQWQQWTRFTGMSAVDACFADDRYYHLYSTSAGQVQLIRYTDDSVATDVNDAGSTAQTFEGYIETPWLQFAGIQGFQRVYRVLLLGAASASQVIRLLTEYDYDTTTPAQASTVTKSPSGGVIQVEHHLATQKCQALKLGVAFRPASTSRLRLTDITLLVGVKFGAHKSAEAF